MGKMIDKRMKELGGNRLLPLCCADEAVGLEETVEGWKTEIMTLLNKLDQLIAASAAVADKSTAVPEVLIVEPIVVAVPVVVEEVPVQVNTWIPSGLLSVSATAAEAAIN